MNIVTIQNKGGILEAIRTDLVTVIDLINQQNQLLIKVDESLSIILKATSGSSILSIHVHSS